MPSLEFAIAAMLGLFVVQIVANLRSQSETSGWLKHHSEHITRGHNG
jgi:hypothetical protein